MKGLLAAIRARPARAPTAPLWGDGFAEDSLVALATAQSWDLCSPDEFIFPFPWLIDRDGVLPAVLLDHLAAAVAARGRLPAARECGITELLDAILHDARAGRRPVPQDGWDALFAFGSGIHPAYRWPEALIAPERGIVAGWLGHLDRGRPALMPQVVAEYVADALGVVVKDPLLLELVGCERRMEQIRQAARRRLRGLHPVVRFKPRQNPHRAHRAGSMAAFDAAAVSP